MRIAVTGASGFIGSHLVPQLKKRNHTVEEISLDHNHDLTIWESVMDISPCDAIVHLAAKTFVPDSFDNPRSFYHINNTATLHTLELARIWKARVIYMSSYFYGQPQYIPVDEKHPLNPHNPYAQTKYISEELCRGYSRDFNVPVIALRLFNIYGPGQTGSFLIPEILETIKHTNKITLKDPRPKRDYIHVFDVVQAIITALGYVQEEFDVFNLGTGRSVSVEELVQKIQKHSPVKFDVEYTHEYRQGEVLDSVACTSLINQKTGWKPSIDIDKGINSLFY